MIAPLLLVFSSCPGAFVLDWEILGRLETFVNNFVSLELQLLRVMHVV